MPLQITTMSPVKVNSTVLAIADLNVSPEIQFDPFQHSGNEFPSVGRLPSAMPKASFRTPFLAAYNLIGLKLLLATTFEVYFATFASGLKQGATAHTKYGLASGAKACLYIAGASVDQNGVLMADVAVILLSADGVTHPLTPTAAVSLPTLGSEPQLHTAGPFAIGGTRVDGATQVGFANNVNFKAPLNDGDMYPRTVGFLGAAPSLSIAHDDPLTLLGSLDLLGSAISSSAAVFFRGIDPTTQLIQTTGVSLTVSSGRIVPGAIAFTLGDVPKVGLTVTALSSTGTHPLTVATAATVP